MSHFLPVDEIREKLRVTVDEFLATSKELKRERYELEADLVRALEREKMVALKKKLDV